MTHPVDEDSIDSPDSIEDGNPTMGDDGLGPLFGSLPPDVLKQVILPELDLLQRGLFALASGACWRAMKDSGLSCRLEKGVVCCLAASGGHLECLRYVREQHGCPWGAATCVEAAGQGHLECLRYAHEHGCPWGADTCARAARQGQLECLRYAHEHGCPWDADTCARAADNGHLECLQYARNHGYPCPEEYCHLWEMMDGSGTVN